MSFSKNRKIKRFYESLENTEKIWVNLYPEATKTEVNAFLEVLTESLNLPMEIISKIGPEKTVQEIFNLVYKTEILKVGTCELEELSKNITKIYSLKIEQVWHTKLKVGELFEATRKA